MIDELYKQRRVILQAQHEGKASAEMLARRDEIEEEIDRLELAEARERGELWTLPIDEAFAELQRRLRNAGVA